MFLLKFFMKVLGGNTEDYPILQLPHPSLEESGFLHQYTQALLLTS